MVRGSIWWAKLPAPMGSTPEYRRPVVIIQADSFNQSQIRTVIIASITSNVRLADAPANIFLNAKSTGLPKDSVINLSQILTIDKMLLEEKVSELSSELLYLLDQGLRQVLDLQF